MNIVSFFAPRPEHPFFQDYRPFLRLLNLSCRRFGHRHIVLTDDPFEVGDQCGDTYATNLPRSLMKAVIAAQYKYLSDPQFSHTPTLLTGADCVLANDPAKVFDNYFDLGITVGNFADCRMNTGAIFVREPCQVAEIWKDALDHVGDNWGDDQTSLYRAILQRPTHGEWWARLREFPVDPYNLAPDNPGDDCTRGVVLHFRGPRKRWMIDYCHKWLDIGEGITLTVGPNSPDDVMRANVQANIAHGLPEIRLTPAHDGHAVLLGGGPSLEASLPEIQWRQAHGQKLFALNGVAAWLAKRGIKADYCVVLDCREQNKRFVEGHEAQCLLASQVAPCLVEAAKDPILWHFVDSASTVNGAQVIYGGIVVGLTAMGLVYAMGYREMHLYGYDSSEANGELHAYEQQETTAEARRYEVWCGSRRFITNPAMYAQAKAFPDWAVQLAEAGVTITVHGDGLLPELARHMNATTPIPEGELAA